MSVCLSKDTSKARSFFKDNVANKNTKEVASPCGSLKVAFPLLHCDNLNVILTFSSWHLPALAAISRLPSVHSNKSKLLTPSDFQSQSPLVEMQNSSAPPRRAWASDLSPVGLDSKIRSHQSNLYHRVMGRAEWIKYLLNIQNSVWHVVSIQ